MMTSFSPSATLPAMPVHSSGMRAVKSPPLTLASTLSRTLPSTCRRRSRRNRALEPPMWRSDLLQDCSISVPRDHIGIRPKTWMTHIKFNSPGKASISRIGATRPAKGTPHVEPVRLSMHGAAVDDVPGTGSPAWDQQLALRSFAFDRLSAIAAVLDGAGVIVDTNEAWRLFAHLNDGSCRPPVRGSATSTFVTVRRPGEPRPRRPSPPDCARSSTASATISRSSIRVRRRRRTGGSCWRHPRPRSRTAPGVVLFHVNTTRRRLLVERLETMATTTRSPACPTVSTPTASSMSS